ncbi:hypothetical protein MNBD_GAMMA04-1441 [hydrothermal vent metagenome]|uniref:Uncharacterized protein n=1 Tax=hydrothermal vent metagenome TaxID=652676 RepID=A0A3B0W7W0_9ZZZZ
MKKLMIAFMLMMPLSVAFAGVVAVSNPSDSYSKSDVTNAWKGKTTAQLVENAAASDAFYSDVIGKSASSVEKKIKRKVFSGRMAPPKTLNSDSEVIKYISSNPGSIGYVNDSSVNSAVKVIK